jgi:hypothetical protein
MNKLGAIRQAQKMFNNRPTLSKSDVLFLISKITAESTYDQKAEGARLLRENVSLFNTTEFNAIAREYINKTGYKPR